MGSTDGRIAFVVNSLAAGDLVGGKKDVTRVYHLLTDEKLGCCDPIRSPEPLYECDAIAAFWNRLQDLVRSWNAADQLVFYFSGHGLFRNSVYCLKFGLAERDYYPFENLLRDLAFRDVTRAILVIDACYSGAATGEKTIPEVGSALARTDIPNGVAILASSQAHVPSRELRNRVGSVFTTLLCEAIETGLGGHATPDGMICVDDVVEYVNRRLMDDATFAEYSQRAQLKCFGADRRIWVARNPSGRPGEQPAPTWPTTAPPGRLQDVYEATPPGRRPCEGATVDELDWVLVEQYARRKFGEHVLTLDRLELLNRLEFFAPLPRGNRTTLHRACVLCFCRNPEAFIFQARALFVGTALEDGRYRSQDIYGPLSHQFQRLLQLAKEHLDTLWEIGEGGKRSEQREIPDQLIRELISNAIAHRDYAANGSVEVRVTPEWLEIRNPGRFKDEVSWESLIQHEYPVSNPMDPAIALYLRNLLIFEQTGRGFAEIRKHLATHGADSIEYQELDGPTTLVRVRRRQHFSVKDPTPESKSSDPESYLLALSQRTQYIDIHGLEVGSGRARRLPIDKLFIRLRSTRAPGAESERANATDWTEPDEAGGSVGIELEEALKNHRVAVLGEPGAGKTTFLRHLAFVLSQRCLGKGTQPERWGLFLPEGAFPILIRLPDFAEHIAISRDRGTGPTTRSDSPAWLPHFLGAESQKSGTGLDETYFREQLENGVSLVLLDGLDEASSQRERILLVELIGNASRAYDECRFIVTCRPPGYGGDVILPDFANVCIAPLDDVAVQTFVARWCEIFCPESAAKAQRDSEELLTSVRSTPDIRRMARNPMMLTALAAAHCNERRLPEQRADLYESVISWLARSRRLRPRRRVPERSIALLEDLALAMQSYPLARLARAPKPWCAQALGPAFREAAEEQRLQMAHKFLAEEELDSGIIVSRGDYLAFWHGSFQQYLAARALAARDPERRELLSQSAPYRREWREVLLLLANILYRQGIGRVDDVFSVVLGQVGEDVPLAHKARCFGLLAGVVRDLSTVDYQPTDRRYRDLANEIMRIFDAKYPECVPIHLAVKAAEALGEAGDPRFAFGSLEENWAEIGPGEFLMGAQSEDPSKPNFDARAEREESPVHAVYLDAYRFGRYPVAVAEYQRFIDDGGYHDEAHWRSGAFDRWDRPEEWEEQMLHPNRPVVGVSWYEAMAYAGWARARLPTEAEWERAARGEDCRRYPWGDDPEPDASLLNCQSSNVGSPTPLGVYARGASGEGILDMAGNVWEWCADWFGYYDEGLVSNPIGPRAGDSRVVRGGAWPNVAAVCRSASRLAAKPAVRRSDVGFRLARDSS